MTETIDTGDAAFVLWSDDDPDVGIGRAKHSYLFERFVWLQLRISRRDTIEDVRCFIQNDDLESDPNGPMRPKGLSMLVRERLIGKTLAEAVATDFEDVGGQPTLVDEAVQRALRDWSRKAAGREKYLPFLPLLEEAQRPATSLIQRILRSIPLLRRFAV